jgi:hypothetical protein
MEVGVNIVWSPLTRPLSHQGRGDSGVIFYVIPNLEIQMTETILFENYEV